jgi:hypothetical protein
VDSKSDQLSVALRRAVLRVLRALIRVLVRHGMTLPAFVDLAKRAYVDVALNDFAIPGRKPSVSRAAVLTGLTRKEAQRIVEEHGASADGTAPMPENRAARVVAGWVRDAVFHGPDGGPLPLRLEGAEPTFATLVRRYSGDVPPRAVLDELLRVGNVERQEDGYVRLLTRAYIPRASDAAKLGILATDVPYLIGTIDHNLQSLEPSRFQRKVMYDNLPSEALDEFRAVASRHAQELIELLDRWLADHDRDVNPAVSGSGRVRVGVGVFSFEEIIEPRADHTSTPGPALRRRASSRQGGKK